MSTSIFCLKTEPNFLMPYISTITMPILTIEDSGNYKLIQVRISSNIFEEFDFGQS